eukprot:jgi/Botrbrau1/1736/Bobra.116_2s0076.1
MTVTLWDRDHRSHSRQAHLLYIRQQNYMAEMTISQMVRLLWSTIIGAQGVVRVSWVRRPSDV